jgi:hypothetical protein
MFFGLLNPCTLTVGGRTGNVQLNGVMAWEPGQVNPITSFTFQGAAALAGT